MIDSDLFSACIFSAAYFEHQSLLSFGHFDAVLQFYVIFSYEFRATSFAHVELLLGSRLLYWCTPIAC